MDEFWNPPQLSENLQRVDKILLTAQNRFPRFDESYLQRPEVENCFGLGQNRKLVNMIMRSTIRILN